jgi:hypothetical protein
MRFAQKCPLLVKIEDVPGGMPLGRLAEMVAMLTSRGVRAMIEFAPDSRIPELNVKLATAGIGTRLPIGCSFEKAKEIIGMLNRRLLRQTAFSFVGGLASRGLAELANEAHIRFGIGEAMDSELQLRGLDEMPEFPVRSAINWTRHTRAC